MRGGIYVDTKCPICGSAFEDNHRTGFFCPQHPEQEAQRYIVRFGRTSLAFREYDEAMGEWVGLNRDHKRGRYDERDYQRGKPLGFDKQITQWLGIKATSIKPNTLKSLKRYVREAVVHFGNKNVKDIGYAELEDYLMTLGRLSAKTRADNLSALHDFYGWLVQRKVIKPDQAPEFPKVKFELRFRNLVDKETQGRIIDEVRRLTAGYNPRIWFGVRLAATYFIRPGELWASKEKDFVIESAEVGNLIIPHPKDKRAKTIPLLPEDIAIYRDFPPGLPETYFFRHEGRSIYGGIPRADGRFGLGTFYSWWKVACRNLGVEGIDLYGGTKSSSMHALREFGADRVARAAHISTNKAAQRYLQPQAADNLKIYEAAAPKRAGEVVEMRKKNETSEV